MTLIIRVKNKAPAMAPMKDPRPPVSAAPPRTAAAMLASAKFWPTHDDDGAEGEGDRDRKELAEDGAGTVAHA